MKRLLWATSACVALLSGAATAATMTFGSVTVDTTAGPASVTVNGPGRSGTFTANPSPVFASVLSIGEAAGGSAGSALFIGERTQNPNSPTFEYKPGSVEVTFATPIFNNPGADFAVFVSGQQNLVNSGGFKETTSVRTLGSTGAFWYNDALEFVETNVNGDDRFGYFTYLYDLSDLGVAPLASVTGIEIANFSPWATVTGGSGDGFSGLIDPTGLSGVSIEGGFGDRFATSGTGGSCTDASPGLPAGTVGNSYCLSGVFGGSTFERFDTDPDLLYIAGVEGSIAPVPLPGAAPLLAAGMALLAFLRRRRSLSAA